MTPSLSGQLQSDLVSESEKFGHAGCQHRCDSAGLEGHDPVSTKARSNAAQMGKEHGASHLIVRTRVC